MSSKWLLSTLLTLVAACGSSSGSISGTPDAPQQIGTADGPPQAGMPDAPASSGADAGATGGDVIVTAPGVPDGDPTTQTIGSGGGIVSEPKTGTTVNFLASTLADGTTVTLQPVTDTMPEGGTDGVAVTLSTDPTQTYLLSFPYGAGEDPDGLNIAVQLDDGSWLAFDTFVNSTAQTLSAVVPPALPGVAGKQPLVSNSNSRIFVKLIATYMVPPSATVHVSGSVDPITPWAKVRERDCPAIVCWGLLCAPCTKTVVNAYPFTNTKAGFTRAWSVDGVEPGNPTVGTIAPKPSTGAAYSAPAQKPSPDTVEVMFVSANATDAMEFVFPRAEVKITSDYAVTAVFFALDDPVCAFMNAGQSDRFTATLTSLPHGSFTLDDIANDRTTLTNEMPRSGLNGTATDDNHAWETFTLTDAIFAGRGTTTAVFVEGMATSSACTFTPNVGPATSVPSVTEPIGFTFTFDETKFADGMQVLPPIDIPNSSGIWSITLREK